MSKPKLMLVRNYGWLMACLLALAPCLTMAATEPLFISELQMDVMGETADDARNLAIQKAKRDALEDLFDKFVPEHKASLMDSLPDKKIEKIIRKIELNNEMIDGNRFRADIRISYSAAMFNQLITEKIEAVESDLQLLTTASLILPVFSTDQRIFLFESTNPWGVAWNDISRNIGRGQLVTPFGDTVDHSLMSAKNALKSDFQSFAPLRRRYGVRDVVVLHASFISRPNMAQKIVDENGEEKQATTLILQVKERRVQQKEDEIKIIEYIMDSQEDKDTLMRRAARDLGIYIMTMQGRVIEQVEDESQELKSIKMVMPVTTMKRFTWVRDRLEQLAAVERLEVLALQPQQADIQIIYSGTRELLLQSLTDAGLEVDDRTQYLELRL